MTIIEWLVLIGTISSVSFAWAVYLLQINNSKSLPDNLKEYEERLIQLMGRVRTFTDTKIELLESKTEELNNLISKVNDIYSKLALDISIYEKKLKDITPQKTVKEQIDEKEPITVEELNERKEKEETAVNVNNKTKSLEEQIVELYNQGMNEAEIAKRFGIGIGEVRLIIDLFFRAGGRKT